MEDIKIIVVMHGGLVEQVLVSDPNAIIGRVVVTESGKYGSETKPEFEIADGGLKGQIIYSECETDLASRETIAAVEKATKERQDYYNKAS